MSYRGIKKVADVYSHLQSLRYELLSDAGALGLTTKAGQQDLRLAHLLEDMKDLTKDKWMEILASVPKEENT